MVLGGTETKLAYTYLHVCRRKRDQQRHRYKLAKRIRKREQEKRAIGKARL